MLPIEDNVQVVRKPRVVNAALKAEIAETLKNMPVGKSFLIKDKIRKGTVQRVSRETNIPVAFAKDADGNLHCFKK